MSSAGHIADMIVRMENNRGLLKHHKRYWEIIEVYAHESLHKPLQWKELNEAERALLIAHLNEVLKRDKRNTLKAIIISLFITAGIIGLMATLFRWVFM